MEICHMCKLLMEEVKERYPRALLQPEPLASSNRVAGGTGLQREDLQGPQP